MPSKGDTTAIPSGVGCGAGLRVQVALDQPSPGDQRAILAAGAAHDIAPAEVGHRAPVRHRARESLIDGRVLILPHAQKSRPHPQVMDRIFQQQRIEPAPWQGPGLLRPCVALAHPIHQCRAAHVGRIHARLELQQPDAERSLQPRVAATGPIHQRTEKKRVHARLDRGLAHAVGKMANGPRRGHALAHCKQGRTEASHVRRAGRGRGLGGPAPDVLQLVHAGPQAVLAATPACRPRCSGRHGQHLSRKQGDCSESRKPEEDHGSDIIGVRITAVEAKSTSG